MSQTKFTKGEWVVTSISGELWVDCGKLCVAKVIGGNLALPEANLIAAAPDMYEELEQAMNMLDSIWKNTGSIGARNKTTKIYNLLKKARGE